MTSNAGYVVRGQRGLNADYTIVGSQYEHVLLWRQHHGVTLNGDEYIIHHKNHDKTDNRVCNKLAPCPDWACGNLGAMTRADHIREHKPGRMGGERLPNKRGRKQYRCIDCGVEKSRNGVRCRRCALVTRP